MFFGSFRGGIHPQKNKHYTEGVRFSNLSIPHQCYIPLLQHAGAPAVPVVGPGDRVSEGQLIAKAAGNISADVHASVPGKVVGIREHPVGNKRTERCVVIESEGSFSTFGKSAARAWEGIDARDLLNLVHDAGVVGMGGAAYPTAAKLTRTGQIKTVIVNGAESEPYLTCDDMLMRTYPTEILEGVRIALRILGIDRAIIGVGNDKPMAIEALKKTLAASTFSERIEIKSLKTKFPQDSERLMIRSVLGREIPATMTPHESEAIVLNVGTAYSIREAVVLGKPLIERFITVTGMIVHRPGNYKVRIGTRVSDLLDECGGLTEPAAMVIMGGPLRGTALEDLDAPVVKGTSGIIFFGKSEARIEPPAACIRCGRCVSVCPVGLLPLELGRDSAREDVGPASAIDAAECINCGACNYACPAHKPLAHSIRLAQEKIQTV